MYYKKPHIPEHLREKFDHFMELEKLHVAQINSILAVFLLSSSIVMDFWALSDTSYSALIARIIAITATLNTTYITFFHPKIFIHYYKYLIVGNYLLIYLALDYIIYLSDPADIAFYIYVMGLDIVLLMMHSWVLLSQRFLFTISIISIAGYVVAMSYNKEAAYHNINDIIIVNLFMIFASISAGLVTRQIRDHIQYENFLLQDSLATSLKQSQEKTNQLSHIAKHDYLTQLKNRKFGEEFIKQYIKEAKIRKKNASLTLLFMDLNGFKAINDNYGHDIGDEVLKIVARRLTLCMRETDHVIRLGGDEFIIILPCQFNSKNLATLFEKIHKSISSPMKIEGVELSIKLSIGSSVYPVDGDNYDALIKIADTKMYKEKPSHSRSLSVALIEGTL